MSKKVKCFVLTALTVLLLGSLAFTTYEVPPTSQPDYIP
jgi:hypothetical protein